jgi:ectoine hydroxylase-related dioxygenase (phytanoyl-CoA dioxygenase family)
MSPSIDLAHFQRVGLSLSLPYRSRLYIATFPRWQRITFVVIQPYGLHWDHDPWDDQTPMLQGVLALTDTAADQGGFCCVPSLVHNRNSWPKAPVVGIDGDENWLAETTGRDIAFIPAKAGDLIVWDWRPPHGNSKNLSTRPRIAFYVEMYPNTNIALRDAAIESWRSGRCVPRWRNRPGYDRIEPWRPARLSELGRRLVGLMRGNQRKFQPAVL